MEKSKNKKQRVRRALPLTIVCIKCRIPMHRGTQVFGDLNGENWTISCKTCPNKLTLTKDGDTVHGCLRIGEIDKLKTPGIDEQSKNPSAFDGSTSTVKNNKTFVNQELRIGQSDKLKTWAIDEQSKNPSAFDGSTSTVKNDKTFVNQEGYNLEAEDAEEWRKKRAEGAEEWRKKRALEIHSVIEENFLAAAKKKKRPRASSSGKVKSSSSERSSSSSSA